jgi:hypothetical protein
VPAPTLTSRHGLRRQAGEASALPKSAVASEPAEIYVSDNEQRRDTTILATARVARNVGADVGTFAPTIALTFVVR